MTTVITKVSAGYSSVKGFASHMVLSSGGPSGMTAFEWNLVPIKTELKLVFKVVSELSGSGWCVDGVFEMKQPVCKEETILGTRGYGRQFGRNDVELEITFPWTRDRQNLVDKWVALKYYEQVTVNGYVVDDKYLMVNTFG